MKEYVVKPLHGPVMIYWEQVITQVSGGGILSRKMDKPNHDNSITQGTFWD